MSQTPEAGLGVWGQVLAAIPTLQTQPAPEPQAQQAPQAPEAPQQASRTVQGEEQVREEAQAGDVTWEEPTGGAYADPPAWHPEDMLSCLLTEIEHSINHAPRSLQTMIGPSEIGDPCDHCLAARLAGWQKKDVATPWLPFIGTCVHEHLEHLFKSLDAKGEGHVRSLQEARVTVGYLGGQPITGSTDLYLFDWANAGKDQAGRRGMTVDWKVVGDSTMKKVRAHGHPGQRYEVQAHLYAKGWNEAGHPTSHVSVVFLPRNRPTLRDTYLWTAPYNPAIASQALERLEGMWERVTLLQSLGEEALTSWISGLPRDPACWDCKKYPDWNHNNDAASIFTTH